MRDLDPRVFVSPIGGKWLVYLMLTICVNLPQTSHLSLSTHMGVLTHLRQIVG